MARIRAKDTAPERIVRSLLHAEGYRFRTHVTFLPGKPDVAFTRRKKVVLIHGCFWHQHPGCPRAAKPSSRIEFWTEKFERNRRRDIRVELALRDAGWSVLVIWECETKRPQPLKARLAAFLGPPRFCGELLPC